VTTVLTSHPSAFQIQRMVHGVNGFIKYASKLTQDQIGKMAAANAELKKRLTDNDRNQLEKVLNEQNNHILYITLFPSTIITKLYTERLQ
jgi:hypothetical protein